MDSDATTETEGRPAATLSVEQALALAVEHHRGQRLEQAQALYQAILQARPQQADALHNLGIIAVQQGRVADSLVHLRAALQVQPQQAQYWLSLAEALLLHGEPQAARELLAQGEQHGLAGEALQALYARLPKAPVPHTLEPARGSSPQPEAQASATSVPGARPFKAASLARKPPPSRRNEPQPEEQARILALFGQGHYEAALAAARAMTQRFPAFGFGWKALGTVLRQLGHPQEALPALKRAAARMPGDAEAHSNLAALLVDLGHHREAEVACRRALSLQPALVAAHYNLGHALRHAGRLAEAMASYRQALHWQPAHIEALRHLGNLHKEQGETQAAEACYRQALAAQPDFLEARCNLGSLLLDSGRVDEAEAAYREVLRQRPGFIEARANLGNLLTQRGEHAAATDEFLRALGQDPLHEFSRFGLCQALYAWSQVQPDIARAHARQVRSRYPDDPIIVRGLAGVLGEHGDSAQEEMYTRELFNHFADSFESTLSKLDYSMPRELAQALDLPAWSAPAALDILDAGCGTGLCGPWLKPWARRLIGVDLAPRMLQQAQAKQVYDALHADELVHFLRQMPQGLDLIVAADVVVYLGELEAFAQAAAAALRPGGRLAFSIERLLPEGQASHRLGASGRYQHDEQHVLQCLAAAGLVTELSRHCVGRVEYGKPVQGCIVLARKAKETA